MMDNEKMAQFIAKLRKENKLTQKELAEQLNVTDKAVSKWERGLSCPEISLLSKLSHILGITTSELLNGEKAESTVPEVEAVVEATHQYADNATKSIVAKSTRWKKIALFSAFLISGILVVIGCGWVIDSGMGWFILPLQLTAFVWLIIMLGVFVMGKNKIATLLLCGFFIYLTTFFYSSLNQVTTRDINTYGEFAGFTREYIPHYTIIIVMFILSIAVTLTSFLIQNKKISVDQIFVLFAVSGTMIILSVLTSKSIMNYVDIHGLGVNPNFTILSLLTFLMNCVSLAILAKRQRRQITR
ncbi:MAG: helix-turn-helix transcriptional regulator [Anaerolineaceae bacterium]|nr:helix-turn-helix transcriptional regulator [Anaerolineaceae bacterium]